MDNGMYYVLAFNGDGECWAKQYVNTEDMARAIFRFAKRTLKHCGGENGARVMIEVAYEGSGRGWETLAEYVHTVA